MDINFDNLFPLGPDEIAQTLIHEMMHLGGHRHPVRTDSDKPFDGGAYYGSAPLQAEICIAGNQSLIGGHRDCYPSGDGYNIQSPA